MTQKPRLGIKPIGQSLVNRGIRRGLYPVFEEWNIDTDEPTGRILARMQGAYYEVSKEYVATKLVVVVQ